MNVLTFDLGTTMLKCAVFDDAQRMLSLARAVIQPTLTGWRLERDDFHALVRSSIDELRKSTAIEAWEDIRRISFATQANSFALFDADDRALTPFFLWPDRCAADAFSELEALIEATLLHRVTGIPRLSPLMTIAKLRWMSGVMPDVIARTQKLRFLSDELMHWLTGQNVTEAGMAALSGLVDIDHLQWWPRALELVEIEPAILPKLVSAGAVVGPIFSAVAGAMGLARNCDVVVGCLDQYAGAIGTGSTRPGDVCETTGTVLAAVRCAEGRSASSGVFEGPSYEPGRYWQMQFSSTSANLLEWYRNSLPGQPDFSTLSQLAAEATSGAPIEPFEAGKPIAQCFRNVTPAHSIGQVVRGIMQCVARALKSQVDDLCGDDKPSLIRSAGGAARSSTWLAIKSEILGVPCVPVDCPEPTSLGAARLALGAANN